MQRLFVPLAGFLLGLFAFAAYGQTHPNNSDPVPASTIQSTAQEVVLDMVFRDRKGKTIRDLRPEEIRISEDGVEQKLTSFRLLDGKTVRSLDATKSAESGPVPLDPTREVRLVTLVFENLDIDGKRFFRQAVKDILDMSPEPNLYFSVLTVDHKLQCIQPFTADHAALLKSLDKSSMWSFIQYTNQSAEVKSELKQTLSGGEPQLQSGGDRRPEPGADSKRGELQNGADAV